jgi:hypothetical protein
MRWEAKVDSLAAHGIERDPVIEVYKRDVDRTLLRENLKLSVEQRLRRWAEHHAFAEELRLAGQRARAGR